MFCINAIKFITKRTQASHPKEQTKNESIKIMIFNLVDYGFSA